MSKRIFITVAAAALLVVSVACDDGLSPCSEAAGTYLSESESEWDVTIDLRADGTGRIVRKVWAPGEYEDAEVEQVDVVWGCRGETVAIEYHGGRDILRFDSSLSMEPMGMDRIAPGLVWQEPKREGSLLIGHHFWEERGWPNR